MKRNEILVRIETLQNLFASNTYLKNELDRNEHLNVGNTADINKLHDEIEELRNALLMERQNNERDEINLHWHDYDKECPPFDGYYLVYAQFNGGKKNTFYVGFYGRYGFKQMKNWQVTHWAELPEPPEEE